MSIAALMNEAAAEATRAERAPREVSRVQAHRRRAADSMSQTNVGSIAGDLSRYLPTEAVALYTGVLPFLVPKSKALSHQDYTSRYWLAIGVGVFAILYAVGLYRREVRARGGEFHWPPKKTVTVVVAYVAWVCVIPGSPLGSLSWYTPAIGAVIGIVASAGIGLFTLWAGSPEA